MILVTGAAGKTGRALLNQLKRRNQPVRGWVRRTEQAHTLAGIDVVVGEMLDPHIWAQALRGVRAIYHICPNLHPDELIIGQLALRAAQIAEVEHFVYHSVLHPQTADMPHHWRKLLVEEEILRSGLNFTILQPAAYMQNVLAYWAQIVEQGLYPIPYHAQTRLGMVNLHDVAEAAALVLTGPDHGGATYELAGPQVLTQHQTAQILAQELGRPVRVQPLDRASWAAQSRAAGLGEYAIDSLLRMFAYYEAYGFWGNSRTLAGLLGRPPTTFAQFIAAHTHQTAHQPEGESW